MADQRPRSEQQEELDRGTPVGDSVDESVNDAGGDGTSGPQFTRPEDASTSRDEEPTEIAEAAGLDYTAGPEERAMRVEDGG